MEEHINSMEAKEVLTKLDDLRKGIGGGSIDLSCGFKSWASLAEDWVCAAAGERSVPTACRGRGENP
eukprot:1399868-Alexandrium_andersonii.AAC.1